MFLLCSKLPESSSRPLAKASTSIGNALPRQHRHCASPGSSPPGGVQVGVRQGAPPGGPQEGRGGAAVGRGGREGGSPCCRSSPLPGPLSDHGWAGLGAAGRAALRRPQRGGGRPCRPSGGLRLPDCPDNPGPPGAARACRAARRAGRDPARLVGFRRPLRARPRPAGSRPRPADPGRDQDRQGRPVGDRGDAEIRGAAGHGGGRPRRRARPHIEPPAEPGGGPAAHAAGFAEAGPKQPARARRPRAGASPRRRPPATASGRSPHRAGTSRWSAAAWATIAAVPAPG